MEGDEQKSDCFAVLSIYMRTLTTCHQVTCGPPWYTTSHHTDADTVDVPTNTNVKPQIRYTNIINCPS